MALGDCRSEMTNDNAAGRALAVLGTPPPPLVRFGDAIVRCDVRKSRVAELSLGFRVDSGLSLPTKTAVTLG